MKVYKVILMVVDRDGLGEKGIVEEIQCVNYPNDCMSPHVFDIDSREIGEFDDDHPLNNGKTWSFEFARLFEPVTP